MDSQKLPRERSGGRRQGLKNSSLKHFCPYHENLPESEVARGRSRQSITETLLYRVTEPVYGPARQLFIAFSSQMPAYHA